MSVYQVYGCLALQAVTTITNTTYGIRNTKVQTVVTRQGAVASGGAERWESQGAGEGAVLVVKQAARVRGTQRASQ